MQTIFSKNPLLDRSEKVAISFLKKGSVFMLRLWLYFSFVINFHYIFAVFKRMPTYRVVHWIWRKGARSGLRQFLALESPLKMMKNAPISSKNLCLFWRCLKFSFDFFGHVGKRFDKKTKVNFKIHDVANW